MKTKLSRLAIVFLTLICLVAFYPSKSTTAHRCEVKVLDAKGQPASEIWVKQIWQDYSVEYSSHEDEAYTDLNGMVVFPERTKRKPLILRFFVSASNLLTQFMHASFNKSVLVMASQYQEQNDLLCEAAYWGQSEAKVNWLPNQTMQLTLALKCEDAMPKKIEPPYFK